MARPEDTLARGAGRNAGGFEQGYDDGLQGQRRNDTRAPLRSPNQTGIPLAPEPQREPPRSAQPGVTPRFDPYLPQGNAQQPRQQAPDAGRGYGDPRQAGRQDPRLEFPAQPQQGFAQDPYQERAPQAAPQQPLPAGGPAPAERRYASPQPGERGAPVRPAQARPGTAAAQPSARTAPPGYAPQAGYGAPGAGRPEAAAPAARQRDPFADGQSRRLPPAGQAPAAARQPYGYAQDGYGEDPYAESADAAAEDEEFDEAEDDEADEGETAPRSRRGLYVLGALAVAIVVGGGLGYAYKISGAGSSGAPRLVQADKAPSKTVPADAGGQTFDTGKKTILDRAGDAGDAGGTGATVVPSQEPVAETTAASDSGGSTDGLSGPRKVPTVVVTPGQPIEAGVSVDSGAGGDQGVPGISLGEPDAAPPAAAPKAPSAATLKAKAKAAIAAAADQAGTAIADTAADAQAVATEAVQQPVKLAGAKKTVKVAAVDPAADAAAADAVDAPAPTKTKTALATPAPTTPTKSASGAYIIQVRSTKTQAESLAYFADLQQSYGSILGAAQPDIQEVDLGAKGKWFRLRIGPPGSGTAAKDLCTKLKAGGLKDCIVAAY